MERERHATTEELLTHAGWVRALSRALVADPHAAADLEQDAWVAALEHPPRTGEGLRSWWSRVVRNEATDSHRVHDRRARREGDVGPAPETPTPLETNAALDAHRRLAAAIERLDEPLRATVIRRYLQGLTSTRIGELDGVPESTVRTRLQRALEALRRDLDERTPGGRAAWSAMLLPLASGDSSSVAATAGAGLSWKTLVAASTLSAALGSAWYFAAVRTPAPARQMVTAAFDRVDPSNRDLLAAPTVDAPRSESIVALMDAPIALGNANPPRARFEARFLDERGAPLRGIQLVCLDRSGRGAVAATDRLLAESDAHGRVALELAAADRSPRRGRNANAAPNAIDFLLEARGAAHRSRTLDGAGTLGETVDLGDVVLEPGTRLSGRVVDEKGVGLSDAVVDLVAPDLSKEEREAARYGTFWRKERAAYALTDESGRFVFEGAPVGTFRAAARVNERAQAISEPLVLVAGEPRELDDFVCGQNPAAIRGRVLQADGTPAKRASIAYRAEHGSEVFWFDHQVAKDGSFVLSDAFLAPVTIAAIGDDPETGEALLRDVPPGTDGLVIHLPVARMIELVVRDPHGVPIEDFSIDVRLVEGETGGGTRDRRPGGIGRVRAREMPFHLSVVAEGHESAKLGPFEQGSAPTRIDVVLAPVGRVVGELVGFGDRTRRSITMRLSPVLPVAAPGKDGFETRIGEPIASSYTDEDGRCSFTVEGSGAHVLWTQANGELLESEAFDLGRPSEHPIAIDGSRVGVIEGRVRVPPEHVGEDVYVILSNGLPEPRIERALTDGRFRVERAQIGTWSVIAEFGRGWADDLRTDAPYEEHPGLQRVAVRAGETVDCTIDLASIDLRELRGRLELRDAQPCTWIASLARIPDTQAARRSSQLATDGTFQVLAGAPGTYAFVLRAVGGPDREDRIDLEVSLRHAPIEWAFRGSAGTLELEGEPRSERLLTRDLGASGTWTTRFAFDADGRARLEGLPAGPCRISDPERPGVADTVEIATATTTRQRVR